MSAAMNCGIYRMDFPDGSSYVGASSSIKQRIQTQLSWLRNGKGQTEKLQRAFDAMGLPLCRTVLVCSQTNLRMYEMIVFKTIEFPLCNPRPGGIAGKTLSAETKALMSNSARCKDQKAQSPRQFETWADPEIRQRRIDGMRKFYSAKKEASNGCK